MRRCCYNRLPEAGDVPPDLTVADKVTRLKSKPPKSYLAIYCICRGYATEPPPARFRPLCARGYAKNRKERHQPNVVGSSPDHAQFTQLDEDMLNLSRYWSNMLESGEIAQKHVFRAWRIGRVTDLVKREWSGNRQSKFTECPYVISSLIRVFRPSKGRRA
jgi:hypothetical protein